MEPARQMVSNIVLEHLKLCIIVLIPHFGVLLLVIRSSRSCAEAEAEGPQPQTAVRTAALLQCGAFLLLIASYALMTSASQDIKALCITLTATVLTVSGWVVYQVIKAFCRGEELLPGAFVLLLAFFDLLMTLEISGSYCLGVLRELP